ncbi:MAG: toll/interleukin-1 receptor domain-containing protein [Ginsengibacter sp.]
MSYLANFQNDVFISYAHVDNAVRNQDEKGWVSQFYNELNFWITQRVGRSDKFKIWLDDRLSNNDVFTDKIKEAIKNSALLITFSSNAYYASEYCLDELKWFYENTSKANPGLVINNMSRIYNIRLNKIENAQWPKECQGTTGYEMFAIPDEGREGLGFPITPGSDKFTKNIQRLADDIYTILTELKKQENVKPGIIGAQPNGQVKPKVFFAKVADTLLNDKNQIIRELEINNIEVVKKVPPPPFNKSEYEKAVEDSLTDSCLSVHLFDTIAGDQMEEGSDTFTEAQVNIAKRLSKEQLIFIPKQLNFEELEDVDYKNFLTGLQNTKTETDKYTLIRESAAPNITLEILEKVNKITAKTINENSIAAAGKSASVFLDFHEQDYKYAINLNNFLSEKGIRTFQCVSGSQPLENIEKFETALKEATALIFILGTVAKEWVIERFNKAIETILIKDYPVSMCAIYLAPQIAYDALPLKRKFLQPQLLDDSKSLSFNPDTVNPFLLQFQ